MFTVYLKCLVINTISTCLVQRAAVLRFIEFSLQEPAVVDWLLIRWHHNNSSYTLVTEPYSYKATALQLHEWVLKLEDINHMIQVSWH